MADRAGRAAKALSFGANAAEYERARPEYPLEAVRWLVDGASGPVVELGAGTGKLTRSLARLGVRVLAVEPDERMLDILRGLRLPEVEPVVGTAETLPVPDGTADAVVAGSAFHWFDLDRTLAECARVLREGGSLAFAWNRRDDRDPAMTLLSDLIRGDEPRAGGRDRDWQRLVEASGLFEQVERAEFRHALSLRPERLGDLLRSYSRVRSLPLDEQASLLARAKAAVGREPGLWQRGLLELPFVVECYRARIRAARGG
jgi:SAM-dependent methyltransferase